MAYKDSKEMSRYVTKWDKEHARRFGLKFMKSTDAELIKILDSQKNKQAFIKKAIRYYYENGCPGLEETDGETE